MTDRRIINIFISCLACIALWFIVPYLPFPKTVGLQIFFGTLVITVFMLSQLSISRWMASTAMKPLVALAIVLGCLVVWISVVYAVSAPYSKYQTPYGPRAVHIKVHPAPKEKIFTAQEPVKDSKGKVVSYKPIKVTGKLQRADIYFRLFVFTNAAGLWRALTTLLMIIMASAFGCLISCILREPNILLPVAGMAALIDVWAVYFGSVAKMLEKAPKVVEAVSASLPHMGSASSGFMAICFIGPADIIFFTMFLAATYRLKMEPNRTFWIGFPMLTLGMIAVVMSSYVPFLSFLYRGLPALTLIGLTVALGNWKRFKLKRDEYIAMAVVAVLLSVVLFVITPIIRGR